MNFAEPVPAAAKTNTIDPECCLEMKKIFGMKKKCTFCGQEILPGEEPITATASYSTPSSPIA